MTTEEAGSDLVVAYVVRHIGCEACGGTYRPEDVQVVLHHDTQWALKATCPVCYVERAITAYDQPPYQQLRRDPGLFVPAPITSDDSSMWADFLATFTGDVYDLLAT
ncbi:MAG: hypothetical protein GXY36_19705 [Chloroflexi bacterium]|nr:hypothetical protein [Chloroflexota bacterium]